MSDGVGSTQWFYDDLNRPTSVTDPFSGTVGYGYDGTGQPNHPHLPRLDRLHRLPLRRRLPSADGHGLGFPPHDLHFDKGGRLGMTTLPNGVVSTYLFDDASRLTSLTHTEDSSTLSSPLDTPTTMSATA